ncbi:RuvB-like protein 1 [Nosema granulosis]|uniref:RuvB-like helicase n=1 Tax=Nosema granulosis TaxID=83296 RepID=A0A9P6H447_9MICR|nr:RuvB-like protein 1 [Nosema granulosis]
MLSSKSRGVHSHIKGLGLDDQGEPIDTPFSFVGQENAREAAGLIVEMVKQKKMAGKGLLLVGPSGCGKTALAVAISEELGIKTPFNILNGSEVYSSEVKKTEVLQAALRKAILVRINEFKNIYEGEVVNLDIVEENDLFDNEAMSIKEVNITLRATKGTKTFKISKQLYEQINQQNIKKGDVVYIETSAGIIKKMGRGESHMNDYDLESEKYVPLPKGDIFRKKEIVQETTLHSLDSSFVHPTGQDVVSLTSQVLNTKKVEITERLRNEVDLMVNNYVEVGKADIIPGVLFIDEANVLDLECFTFLHKAIDSANSPIIILASNDINNYNINNYNINNYNINNYDKNSIGIPQDFLNRLMIIPIKKNTPENNNRIIQMRLTEEEVEISKDGLDFLFELCKTKSLRYCLSLISLFKTYNKEITKVEIEELSELFLDC